MGIFSIFTGKIDAGKVFDTVSRGVDKLNFSEQERATMNANLADKLAEYAKDTLSESTVRSQTRRYVSIAVVSVYLLLVLLTVVLALIGRSDQYVNQLVTDSTLTTGFVMVLAFFFGGYYLKQISLTKGK